MGGERLRVGDRPTPRSDSTFITAFTQSGIPATVADKMIERMKGNLPRWQELISQSFLHEKMKADYSLLLNKRISLL